MTYWRSILLAALLLASTVPCSMAGAEGLSVPHIGFTFGAGWINADFSDNYRHDFAGGGLSLGLILSYPYTERNRLAVETMLAAGEGDTVNSSTFSARGVWSHRLSAANPGFLVRAGGGWSEVHEGDYYAGGLTILGGIGYAISDRFSLHTDFTWGGSTNDYDRHTQRGFTFAFTWWVW